MPTLLDIAGVSPALQVDGVAQQPIDGRSMVDTLFDAGAPSPRTTQYFEMLGSRAIYHDGWKATTDHLPYPRMWEPPMEGSVDFDRDAWSLFDLQADFSEAIDLAADEPARLRRMVELWQSEAERNQVLPLCDTPDGRSDVPARRAAESTRHIYFSSEHAVSTPNILAASFDLTVELDAGPESSGVICAHHPQPYTFSARPVWSLHIERDTLVLTWGLRAEQQVRMPDALGTGDRVVRVRHRPVSEGTARVEVTIDGAVRGEVLVSRVGAPPVHDLYVGRGVGVARKGYDPQARLTRSIRRVVLEVGQVWPLL